MILKFNLLLSLTFLIINRIKINMSNQFFVLLPSDSPEYPENTSSKYRVHLARPLDLQGTWLCGIHSIQYVHSWPTLGMKTFYENKLYYFF